LDYRARPHVPSENAQRGCEHVWYRSVNPLIVKEAFLACTRLADSGSRIHDEGYAECWEKLLRVLPKRQKASQGTYVSIL
jgi:hypothetical protein